MHAVKLVLVFVLACASSYACGDTIGPVLYNGLADSPFHPTSPGSSFFFEDFSTSPTVVYRQLPPYGYSYPFASISTPGVEIEGMITWDGSHLGTIGACTDSIPPSCHASIGMQFNANGLGSFPRAVGFAVAGFRTFTLSVYDAHDQLAQTTSVNLDQYYNPSEAPPDEIIVSPLPPFIFLGATDADGISRLVLSANSWTFAVDDFQFGELVPEPPASALLMVALVFLALWRFRLCQLPAPIKPAVRARPCAAGG
jgi:hypothetical protein